MVFASDGDDANDTNKVGEAEVGEAKVGDKVQVSEIEIGDEVCEANIEVCKVFELARLRGF